MSAVFAIGSKIRTTGTVPAVGGAVYAIGEEFDVMDYKRTGRGDIAGYKLGRLGEVVTYAWLDQVEAVGHQPMIEDIGPRLSEAILDLDRDGLLTLIRKAQSNILFFELMVTARGMDDTTTQDAWRNVRKTVFHEGS